VISCTKLGPTEEVWQPCLRVEKTMAVPDAPQVSGRKTCKCLKVGGSTGFENIVVVL